MKNTSLLLLIAGSILVSAIIIAMAIYQKPEGRYQFQVSSPGGVMWILDTRTGTLVDLRSSNLVREKKNGKEVPVKGNYD